MKTQILNFLHSMGIEKCGVARRGEKTAVVCLFPYFSGFREGNLSVYAYSRDYHLIIGQKLECAASFIETLAPGAQCSCHCDVGEAVDRLLAYSAGLGFYGENTMLINDDYGSFFFIGYILCNIPLEPDKPLDRECMHCGLCRKSCPGGAIGNSFDVSKCASHISQKKGELAQWEKDILKQSGCVFGCDICQRVCPHNRGRLFAMEEFKENLQYNISLADIENMSGREFMRVYKDRAFSWRGKKVIERNLKIIGRGK